MTIHLFIDSNVYLKFYHFSNDDLEELAKLIVLLDNDDLELYLPEQTVNEFYRNRDTKLADALKTFRESKLNNQFPQFCKEYNEYKTLKTIIINYDKEKKTLLENVMLAIKSKKLKADDLIEMLFAKANHFETTLDIVKKAKLRYEIGNPPGKNKSYGDAINWETLIANVQNSNDLYFIADDKDYFSEIDKSNFNTFLSDEWESIKSSKIKLYKTLSDFFKDVFPNIKLSTELEKDILITKLLKSNSFKNSRKILYKLFKFDTFSTEQSTKYVEAILNNSQVRWISEDVDINEILYEFVEKNKENIDDELLTKFYSIIPNLKVSTSTSKK